MFIYFKEKKNLFIFIYFLVFNKLTKKTKHLFVELVTIKNLLFFNYYYYLLTIAVYTQGQQLCQKHCFLKESKTKIKFDFYK